MSRIFVEEHGVYQIDLSNAEKAVGDLNKKYKTIGHFLSDVDFIAETKEEVFLIEYKNTDIEKADPKKFLEKIHTKEINDLIHKKFYGSMFYVLATSRDKKINYILVLECEKADSVIRKRIKTKAKKRLPFRLQEDSSISINLINEFDILSIAEWNEKYAQFPLTKITK